MSGTRRLKNAALSGMSARNTMVVPCMVKSSVKRSADTMSASGLDSCRRIRSASTPPIMKKERAVTRYSTAIRLWSTVVIQLQAVPEKVRVSGAVAVNVAMWSPSVGRQCAVSRASLS